MHVINKEKQQHYNISLIC